MKSATPWIALLFQGCNRIKGCKNNAPNCFILVESFMNNPHIWPLSNMQLIFGSIIHVIFIRKWESIAYAREKSYGLLRLGEQCSWSQDLFDGTRTPQFQAREVIHIILYRLFPIPYFLRQIAFPASSPDPILPTDPPADASINPWKLSENNEIGQVHPRSGQMRRCEKRGAVKVKTCSAPFFWRGVRCEHLQVIPYV